MVFFLPIKRMSKKKQNTQTFEDENENTEFISKPLRNFRNKLQRVKRRDQEVSLISIKSRLMKNYSFHKKKL